MLETLDLPVLVNELDKLLKEDEVLVSDKLLGSMV
jgi:hypothetical protein